MNKKQNNTKNRLNQFLKIVELLIYDLNQEVNNEKKIKIYFDAADIIKAIEGIPVYYDYDVDSENPALSFNQNIFNSRRTLVNSLAVSGMLGMIHLLLPHQGELSVRVKSWLEHGTNLKKPPDELARGFLDDTGFNEVEWEKIAKENNPSEKADEIVRQIPIHKAKTFFKAVQFLQPWHSRLLDMIKEGFLETSNIRVHYQPMGMFPLIYDLKEALEKRRFNYDSSNITDALAMGTLIEKINHYKNGKSNELPCFFVSEYSYREKNNLRFLRPSPNAFRRVIKSPEFESYFYLDDVAKMSAIRNDEYFIFRATFVNKKNLKASLEQLCDWRDEIKDILTTPNLSELDKKLDDKKSKTDDLRSWIHLIEDMENDSFFNLIWLPSEAPKKFSIAVKGIVEASEKVKHLSIIKESSKEQLKQIARDWERQADVFKAIRSMWEKLGTRIRRWRKTDIFEKNSEKEIEQEIFKEFGFFRYSFPLETRKIITSHIRELLQGGNTEKEARRRFLFDYVTSLESEEIQNTTLAIVISSLLVMEDNNNLKKMLKKHIYSTSHSKVHFSFRIVYGKLLLDLDTYRPIKKSTCEEVKGVINMLREEFYDEKDAYEKAKLARGIAYLYYWLWIGKGGEVSWRKPLQRKYRKDSELQKFIDYAIDYAKKSYFTLEEVEDENLDDNQKRLLEIEKTYALNMYLYHLVEDNRMVERKKEIAVIGESLERFRNNIYVWQYRYEDTLAVYYAKMALMENSRPKRKEYIGIAQKRVNSAIEHIKRVYGREALNGKDRDVKEHQEEISILKFRIYNPQKEVENISFE